MAVKNLVAKAWSLAISFDNYRWSAYPLGDKPTGYQTAPTLLDTDIIAGQIAGGENNKGAYLRLAGYGFGRQSNLGTASGARVYLRDPLGDNAWHEVDNYRYLILSKVFFKLQVQELCVQVGALGGSQVAGRALDVKVTVNGVDTNVMVGQFTISLGRFAFIDNVSGVNATALFDDITKPWLTPQDWVSGSTFTGLCGGTTAMGEAGLRSGDTLVFRAHAGVPWTWQGGYEGRRFFRFRIHTGTPAVGVVGSGPIHFTVYPGPVLGNAPEPFVYNDPSAGGGFIHGCNTSWGYPNQQTTFTASISGTTMTVTAVSGGQTGSLSKGNYLDTASGVAEGTTIMAQLTGTAGQAGTYQVSVPQTLSSRAMFTQGFGQHWSASGFTVTLNATSASDAAGFNLQTSSNYARFYFNEVGSWPSTLSPLSAAIGGNGLGAKIKFNYVHDIGGVESGNGATNHGVYLDGNMICAKNCEVAYNVITNCYFGSCFQTHNQVASDQFIGITVHHNWMDGSAKYGIECGSSTKSISSWDNVIMNMALAGISFDSGETSQVQNHSHNLILGCNTNGFAPFGAVSNVSTAGAGSAIKVQHNTVVLGTGRTGTVQNADFYYTYSPDSNGAVSFAQNLYYDPDHAQAWAKTAPGADATAITGDPLFTDATTGNYTVLAGSPTLAACTLAEIQAVATDFYGVARPVTGTGAPGGTKNDIGPFQGVGT